MEQFEAFVGDKAVEKKEAAQQSDAEQSSERAAEKNAEQKERFDMIGVTSEVSYRTLDGELRQGAIVTKKNEEDMTLEVMDETFKDTPLAHGTVISVDQIVDVMPAKE